MKFIKTVIEEREALSIYSGIYNGEKFIIYKDYKSDLQHRPSKPSLIYETGWKFWKQYGNLHREDGPAWQSCDVRYYLDNTLITNKEEFLYKLGNKVVIAEDQYFLIDGRPIDLSYFKEQNEI